MNEDWKHSSIKEKWHLPLLFNNKESKSTFFSPFFSVTALFTETIILSSRKKDTRFRFPAQLTSPTTDNNAKSYLLDSSRRWARCINPFCSNHTTAQWGIQGSQVWEKHAREFVLSLSSLMLMCSHWEYELVFSSCSEECFCTLLETGLT